MINSRELTELHPRVAALALRLIEESKKQGIDLLITSTYRDIESQNALYRIGRNIKGAGITKSRPMGNIVTNASGGQSFHNWRVAFDFVPIVAGKAMWNNIAMFKMVGAIGKSLGLEWAGDWQRMKEMAHFQLTDGFTIKDFQAGKVLA